MRSSNNVANGEAFLFSISVMKLNTCRMVLAAFATSQFAFVPPEPLP